MASTNGLRRVDWMIPGLLFGLVFGACDSEPKRDVSGAVRERAGGAAMSAPDAGLPEADASPGGAGPSAPDAGLAELPDAEVDDPPVVACGVRGGAICGAGEFCDFGDGKACGDSDRGGRCEHVPERCTEVYQPVCGCNNRSYSNACEAHGHSVSVKHAGLCDVEECKLAGGRPSLSDGASTPQCKTGERQWSVGGVDEPAVCCLPGDQSKACGGAESLECDAEAFCNYERAAGGQGCEVMGAHPAGVCETRPRACGDRFDPICGCDRRSYEDVCAAHAAGVSQLHAGRCTELDCAQIGGHAVDGIGPGPMCPKDEELYTFIAYSNGVIAIEGTACCVPR